MSNNTDTDTDTVLLTTTAFPVDESVLQTDAASGYTLPASTVLPDSTNVELTADTTYDMFTVGVTASTVTGTTFSYADGDNDTFKLVFKGWGNATVTTNAAVQTVVSNDFNFTDTAVNLVFGQFMRVSNNTFNLAAGSTLQLTEYYNSSSGLATGTNSSQGFLNNTLVMGANSQLSLVLNSSYVVYTGATTAYLNQYNITGNTFTFGDNSTINLSAGEDIVYPATANAIYGTSYTSNTFNLGENNTLTLGETYVSALGNTINAGTGSVINFQNNHSDSYNSVTYTTTDFSSNGTRQVVNNSGSIGTNVWGSTNKFVYADGVTNVTVNVDPNFNMLLSEWDTGVNGTVNFSGRLNFNSTTAPTTNVIVNVGDGSAFNIIGETAAVRSTTFNLGKGASLNIGEDVLLPTSARYNTASLLYLTDTTTGTVINSDNKTLINTQAGIFNSIVDFSGADSSSTLTIGNLSLTAGKEITYLLNINGMTADQGRILLENLNGFEISNVVFKNQSVEGSTTTNANAYVQINFVNDNGDTAILNLKMDVHGELIWTPVTDSAGNIVSYYLSVCFNEGTLIETIEGDKAVETISRGDLVKTKDGIRAVSWVGHKSKQVSSRSKNEDFLVLIHKNALADNVPSRDLRVTAEHCLYVDGKLVPARMLVNGRSIIYDLETTSYTIWHIECAQHQIIFAENVAVESYLDTGNRYTFTGCDNIVSLHDKNATSVQYAADLCTSTDFVQPIWEQFNKRAIDLNFEEIVSRYEESNSPNIYLCTDDGQEIYPTDVQNQVFTFTVTKPTEFVSIMSYVSRPEEVFGSFVDDRRELGIAVGEIKIVSSDGNEVTIDNHLSSEAKVVGWYDLEGQEARYRWTKGCAYLPLSMDSNKQYTISIEVISMLPKYLKKAVKYNFLYKKVS